MVSGSTLTGKLVPAMIVLHVGTALLFIFINIAEVPSAVGMIFTHAFTPAAATGRFAGAAVAAAIRLAVERAGFRANGAAAAVRRGRGLRHASS